MTTIHRIPGDKLASVLLCLCLVLGPALPVGAWELSSGPLSGLTSLEKALYGKEGVGSVLQRLEQLESDVLGARQEGPIVARLESINTALRGPGESLFFRLATLEWFVTRSVSQEPIGVRVNRVETLLIGQAGTGPLGPRLDRLAKLTWAEGKAGGAAVQVEKGTLVKIRLGTELSSQSSKIGDKVKFQVTQDLKVEGRIIFPAGTQGEGQVTEVTSAGNLGRDGRVVVDFGSLVALDGQALPVTVDEKATEMNKSLQVAAGASMAGVLLLGPVGLVGGYFVRGKDVTIPIGTEFFISIRNSTSVTGLMSPGSK